MRNCSEDELIVFSIITSVVMVASVCGNSLLIIVFCKFSSQRTASNVLVMGLVIADSLIPIVFILYLADTLMPHGSDRCDRKQLCKVSAWFSIILMAVIVLHFTLINMESFIAVKFSLRYHSILTNRRAVMASVAMWLWAVLVTSVFPQALRADENEAFNKFVVSLYPCYPRLCSQSRGKFASAKVYNTLLFIILLGIPLVTILSSSRNHRRRINAQDSNPAQLSTIKQEFKVTLILAIVVLLCLLSFLPLFILSIISFQFENTNRDNSNCYFFSLRRCKKYAYLVALGLNAICNPLIYGLGNRRLRNAIRTLLKCSNLEEN